MKAAILHTLGTNPKFENFETPEPQQENQVLITVKASSLKQLDKSKASGKHYTKYPYFPIAVGVDGTGILEDGTRIYASGLTGMFAEKALVEKDHWTILPDGIDFETAAALPNALIGSDMALLYRAEIKKGDVILINGATGVTGKIAVQMARYRGASKVIVTGRNAKILEELKELGADEVISLQDSYNSIIEQLTIIHNTNPIDIVLDYLWGHPMELILTAFKNTTPRKIKIVTVGEMAGATISLTSSQLRSMPIELLGSGIGSISRETFAIYMKDILPSLFQLVADGILKIDIETVELKDIEMVWSKNDLPGKRTVVRI
ncbi:quinone oxidoreductase family protein [Flavobacterium sp. '19STA2R22 D10 B1']|uniref:quinone oxidoreductase family protein n=1 Tax=Flavobacterium aerium TaxID=3037261 RepID=UPI00278C09DA|nr:zinc-binding dehydrogenase [Flavobacterium sp. '19STA2R22 D10 B1']